MPGVYIDLLDLYMHQAYISTDRNYVIRGGGRLPVTSGLFKWIHIGSIRSERVGGKPW